MTGGNKRKMIVGSTMTTRHIHFTRSCFSLFHFRPIQFEIANKTKWRDRWRKKGHDVDDFDFAINALMANMLRYVPIYSLDLGNRIGICKVCWMQLIYCLLRKKISLLLLLLLVTYGSICWDCKLIEGKKLDAARRLLINADVAAGISLQRSSYTTSMMLIKPLQIFLPRR